MTDEEMMEWHESQSDNQLIAGGYVHITKGDDRREVDAWNKFAEDQLTEYDNRDPKLMPIRMGFANGYLAALRGEREGYGHEIVGVASDILLMRWEHRIDELETRYDRRDSHENQALGIQACVDDLREFIKGVALSKRNEAEREVKAAQAGLPGSSGSSRADERTNTKHSGAQEHNGLISHGNK